MYIYIYISTHITYICLINYVCIHILGLRFSSKRGFSRDRQMRLKNTRRYDMGLSENPDRNPMGGGATEAEMLNEYGTYSKKFCSPIPFLDLPLVQKHVFN